MKAERNFPYAIVTKKAEKMLTAGHVWVYDAEITDMGGWPEEPAGGLEGGSLPEYLADIEQTVIRRYMTINGGNVTKTARDLGLLRQNLQHKLKKYEII